MDKFVRKLTVEEVRQRDVERARFAVMVAEARAIWNAACDVAKEEKSAWDAIQRAHENTFAYILYGPKVHVNDAPLINMEQMMKNGKLHANALKAQATALGWKGYGTKPPEEILEHLLFAAGKCLRQRCGNLKTSEECSEQNRTAFVCFHDCVAANCLLFS